MDEIWKPVVGFEGRYEVSDQGRVRSFLQHPNGKVLKTFPGGSKGEYQNVHLMPGRRTFGVHALVAAAFLGPRPQGKQVAHRDGNAAHNHAGNLAYLTPKQNCHDKQVHGTILIGTEHPRSKITCVIAVAIRAAKGVRRQVDLAADHGVDQTTISCIQRGVTWRHA